GPPPRLQSLSATPLPHDQRRPTSPAHYAYSSIQFAPTPVSGTTYGAGYGPVASLPEEAFYAQHYAPLQYLPNQGTPFSQQHAPAMYAPPSLPREMKIEPHTPSPLYQEGSYAPQGMSSNTASHGQYDHVWLGPNQAIKLRNNQIRMNSQRPSSTTSHTGRLKRLLSKVPILVHLPTLALLPIRLSTVGARRCDRKVVANRVGSQDRSSQDLSYRCLLISSR
ncbi:hypothetical protein LTR16_004805, partial [Cryomyces antarcticus]